MARMKLRFLFFAVFMVLFGLAGAASAEEVVVVDVVAATQYESLFVAGVVAHGGTDLDVQLSVDGGASLGEPDKISKVEYDQLHNLTLWKIVYNRGDVVLPGQTMTATVSDVSGASDDKTVTCRRGLLRLRQRAVCF